MSPVYAELELYKSLRQDMVDGLPFGYCEQCGIPYCKARPIGLVICYYYHDGLTQCGGTLCCNRLTCTMENVPQCNICQKSLCSDEMVTCTANECFCPNEPHKTKCNTLMCLETCVRWYCDMCQEAFCPDHVGQDGLCMCCKSETQN